MDFEFNVVSTCHFPYAYCVPRPFYPSSFDHLNNFTRRQIMKVLVMLSPPSFCNVSSLRSNSNVLLVTFLQGSLKQRDNIFAMQGKLSPCGTTLSLFPNRVLMTLQSYLLSLSCGFQANPSNFSESFL